jgi:tripartite-type tricarboxylate transporter receptor subunit TctC
MPRIHAAEVVLAVVLAYAPAAVFMPAARAQQYPTKPIRLIVPQPPAGPNDFLARALAAPMAAGLGQPVVVENRPGASGVVGQEFVARQPPDGYTILEVAASIVLNVNFPPRPPYDPIKDFAPIGRAADTTFMLTVKPGLKTTTIKEFIALARANPGKLTYATVGYGSPHHLAGELFQYLTGTKLLQVNYKGGAQITQALISGEVDATFISTFPVRALVQAGKLNGLGVTTTYRSPLLPDVPTIAEAVPLPGYELNIWQGFLAPAGTPATIVQRLNREMNAALKDPKIRAQLTELGLDPAGGSPEEFAATLARDMAKWSALIKEANIKVE